MVLSFLLTSALVLSPLSAPKESCIDTIAESVLVSSYKQIVPIERIASPVSTVGIEEMESRGMGSIKSFSSLVPNLHIPDYGSAMTSSIYLRGLGSRMDNPVIGLYVDDIPVMNKNSYDFDMMDISGAALLRGPQATLYGRNSMCGVLVVKTLSSDDFQGFKASLEYGSANTVSAKLSCYGENGLGLMIGYRHSDGYYCNYYNGKMADPYDALNLRFRASKKIRRDLVFENILSASLLGQGGYPYREYDFSESVLKPLAYNDPCGYKRLNVTDGIKFKYMPETFSLSSVTSFQFLSDKMTLDQDFTTASLFTMSQAQNEGALTQELILKPESGWRTSWWNWQTGFFGFFKHNAMSAPVRFKKDGIDDIILANANAGMQSGLPGAHLYIKENEFDIDSRFGISTLGLALYHESCFNFGNWLLTAGLRLDYEGAWMNYDCFSALNYRLEAPGLGTPAGYRYYECEYKGTSDNAWFEVMPKISALYDFGNIKAFASVSKGYKSGGFNVQLFSDILQNKMMQGIMNDMGVYPDEASFTSAGKTSYKPESCWDAEAGFRFDVPVGEHRFSGALSAFYIACSDQQITVFPPGKNTGRMMANVGRSASCGVETDLSYNWKGLSFNASYGYCNARFVKYDDGNNDYSGNRLPYSPEHTLNALVAYKWDMRNDYFRNIEFSVGASGAGRIWWDEANGLYQPFYCLLNVGVRASFRWFDVYLQGDNLLDSMYNVFYFKSVGRSFYQIGKPLRLTIGIAVTI